MLINILQYIWHWFPTHIHTRALHIRIYIYIFFHYHKTPLIVTFVYDDLCERVAHTKNMLCRFIGWMSKIRIFNSHPIHMISGRDNRVPLYCPVATWRLAINEKPIKAIKGIYFYRLWTWFRRFLLYRTIIFRSTGHIRATDGYAHFKCDGKYTTREKILRNNNPADSGNYKCNSESFLTLTALKIFLFLIYRYWKFLCINWYIENDFFNALKYTEH